MSTVIAGSAMRTKTLADGTLRLEVDIEPKDAKLAFNLFGSPGTAVALAALKTDAQQTAETEPDSELPKGGELSKLAGRWCGSPVFHEWLMQSFPFLWREVEENLLADLSSKVEPGKPEIAAELIRTHCGVSSRAQLDHDKLAAQQFNAAIRQPFAEHLARHDLTP